MIGRACFTVTIAWAVTLLLSVSAQALPGDPASELVSPAAGAVVAGDPDGVPVSFTCPRFHPLIVAGDYTAGAEAYFAAFSRSAAVDVNGALTDDVVTVRVSDDGAGACSSALVTRTGAESSASAPEIVGGRIFWQSVRVCSDCAGGQENSAVGAFTVRPRAPDVRLRGPARAYAGYAAAFAARLDSTRAGARAVVLERRSRSGWKTLDTQPVSTDTTLTLGALPRGRQTVRLRALVGEASFVVATRRLRVRADVNRATSRRDDGRLRDRRAIDEQHGPAQVDIAGRGRRIRSFTALVPVTCVLPNPAGGPPLERITTLTAARTNIGIAPDGTVASYLAVSPDEGSGILTGRVRDRRFVGSVSLSAGNCAGSRRVTATR